MVSHADSVDVGRIKTLCCAAAERARLKGLPTLILVRSAGFQGHAAAKRRETGRGQSSRESWDPVAHLRQRLLDAYEMREVELKAIEKAVRDRISSAAAASRARK
jgi:TPP-dependent pyruvate/acetoin dehydrogenase alpha subunit